MPRKKPVTAAVEPEPTSLPSQEAQYPVRRIAHAWPFALSCLAGGGIVRNVPAASVTRPTSANPASSEMAGQPGVAFDLRAINGVRY